jgi:putative hydrolase of the HAD superfamily
VNVVGLGRYFQASISAHRVGVAKPDARIFALAAEAAGVPAASVLHVGDDALLDARGAMDAGMHAVWLNRAGVDWAHGGAKPTVTVASLAQLCQGLA